MSTVCSFCRTPMMKTTQFCSTICQTKDYIQCCASKKELREIIIECVKALEEWDGDTE